MGVPARARELAFETLLDPRMSLVVFAFVAGFIAAKRGT
jgi:hypothetical protein